MPTTHKAPLFYAIAAYVAWGGFPLFWRFLQAIPALEVVSHRVVWSALFLSLLLWQRGLWPAWRHSLRPGKHRIYFLVSSLLISSNWLIYVWAVNAKHVLETSLGYFINPLLSIALGVLIFRERLRPVQYLCLGLACLGVFIMSFQAHHFPWIALGLAGTFGGYGLLRKKMDVDSLVANQIDAMLIAIPALFYIGWQLATGQSTALHAPILQQGLLITGGMITALPLIWFARAARGLPLSTMGFLQFIAPSLQFCIGLFVYQEPFDSAEFYSFLCIWTALLLLVAENQWRSRSIQTQKS